MFIIAGRNPWPPALNDNPGALDDGKREKPSSLVGFHYSFSPASLLRPLRKPQGQEFILIETFRFKDKY